MRSLVTLLTALALVLPARGADPKKPAAPKVTYVDHVLPFFRD
jgi:hypothetical protein